MGNAKRQIVISVFFMAVTFALGLGVGVGLYPQLVPAPADPGAPAAQAAHSDHIDLSSAAIRNLDLELGSVTLSDFRKTQTMPGEVIEIAGESDLSVAAPVGGVIEQVDVRRGEAVDRGHTLFTLRITDQAVIASQSKLLETVSQLKIAETEIERLNPFSAGGAVPANRKRELEYQAEQLRALRETRIQELRALGLPQPTLQAVLANGRLADRLRIAVPEFELTGTLPGSATKSVSQEDQASPLGYSIAELHAHPGLAVKTGQGLCDLSYHGRLYIKGQAFESDLATISKLADAGDGITAEFGHQHHGGHTHLMVQHDLSVLHIDNHVDTETQTFSFYLPLANDVVQDLSREGRVFRQWQFKPGQRVHLRVPLGPPTSAIQLPLEAVAMEGPRAIVFRKRPSLYDLSHAGHNHDHPDDHPDDGGHDHGHDHEHDHGIELEPVEVRIVDRDDQVAVIAPDGELEVGDTVAMNNAYKLRLVMRLDAGGGGHHDHDH